MALIGKFFDIARIAFPAAILPHISLPKEQTPIAGETK
jgi:hypothetical protein